MGFMLRGVRMFLRRVFISKTAPAQFIRLCLLVFFIIFMMWLAVLRNTSPLCVHRYINEPSIIFGGLSQQASAAAAAASHRPVDRGFYQISDKDIYVYSSFYDNRYGSKYIRIFGMQNRLISATIYCKLQLENGAKVQLPSEMSYPVYKKWPSTQLLYHAYYYGCTVPATYNLTSNVTLLLTAEGSDVETAVPLTVTKKRAKRIDTDQRTSNTGRRRIVVCVKAIWGKVNATRLIEWLEFNRLLGVQKIVFYDTTTWGPASRILEHYRSSGFVDVVWFDYALRMAAVMRDDPFRDQLGDDRVLLEQSYLVSMNDCYYRYKDKADYVAVIDYDEIIVPSNHGTLTQMLQDAEKLKLNASAFLFQTGWHLEEFGVGDPSAPGYLHTQRYTKRSPVMKSQPKAMISVDGAIVVNWHGSVTMPTGYGFQGNQYLQWKRYGYVHHYSKQCKYAEAKCEVLAQMVELDEVIPKYEEDLSKAVLKAAARLNITRFLH